MNAILKTLKRYGTMVEVSSRNDGIRGTGRIQSMSKGECIVDDLYGGAFGFAIDKVTGIRIDDGCPALIIVK